MPILGIFKNIKNWVLKEVLWAEKELRGKTGKEKKAAVIRRIDDMLRLPWWAEWIDDALIGWIIDLVCQDLNWRTNGDFDDLELSDTEVAAIVEAVGYSVTAIPVNEPIKEQIAELEAEEDWGDVQRLNDAPGAPSVAESDEEHTPWQIPYWNNDTRPGITPPMSEEEMKQREARFQKAINFCLKWIDKRNFSIVNCEPVVKPAMSDNGFGPMAWGVSVPTLKAAYLAGIVGHWNIGKLTKDEAKAIYRRYYWERYGWGELDWPVCLCCLDASINHSGFAWILQMALVDCGCKIAIDGKFGPKTFAALKTREPARLAAKIISYDKAYCEQQAAQDTSITHLNAMAKEAGVELEDVEIDPE